MASPASTQALPVLIVGAGPAGLVAAITLARHGVRVLVVEKRANSSTLPRALVISTRSMEILRSWGFEEAVRKVPEVMECYLMSGEYDYLLRVVLADTADFERLHSQHLTRLPNVARVHSSFALRTVQKSRELPVRA